MAKSKKKSSGRKGRKLTGKALAAARKNIKKAQAALHRGSRKPRRAGVKTMAKKGGRRGGRRPKSKRGRAGFRFSVVGTARKVAKMSGPIDALANAADNIAAGDWSGGLKEGFSHLSSDLTGFDVVNHEMRPQDLLWGYGPGITVEVINGGLHFIKSIARGFGGRSQPAM